MLQKYEMKWVGIFAENRNIKPHILEIFTKSAREKSGDSEGKRTRGLEKILGMKIHDGKKFIYGYK